MKVPPKALAILWLQASRPGGVVTKSALLDGVWPDTVVGEDALAFQIGLLRRTLADDARAPRYIETVHRVGYRFIAPVAVAPPAAGVAGDAPRPEARAAPVPALVGRTGERARLDALLARARAGHRQVVFVTGEAGIGKTAVLEAFLAARVPAALRVGRGQCVEHHGAGEAYLPLLEAVGRLCHGPGGERVREIMRRQAPSWLVQLPAFVPASELETLQRAARHVTRARMLRELVDALDALTSEEAVVLVLEDLHWGDPSTVEWLAMVARRREPARLLVLGTYRPGDLIGTAHPLKTLKHELIGHGQAIELALGPLGRQAVGTYVARRLAGRTSPEALAAFVYRRTEGHPLFMVQMADFLAQQDAWCPDPATSATLPPAVEHAVPQQLGELIEAQLARLPMAEQRVLEVASVAGAEFAVAGVASGAEMPADLVERLCQGLARRGQFIEDRGLARWPDGTLGGRYGFRHALYQDVLSRRLGPGHRARLHLVIGARKATGYGEHTDDIAAELAAHFEQGQDPARAAHHHREAAEKALRRRAYPEALAHADRGSALLGDEPCDPDAMREALRLQLVRGAALGAAKGNGAPEIEHTYTRALRLSDQLGDVPALVTALYRLWDFQLSQADLSRAHGLGTQLSAIARRESTYRLRAHNAEGWTALFAGAPAGARAHFEHAMALHERQAHRADAAYADDAGLVCSGGAGLACWLLGHPPQARRHLDHCKALATTLAHPVGEAQVLWIDAMVAQQRGDCEGVRDSTRPLMRLCAEHGFPFWLAGGRILQGWVSAERGDPDEGIGLIRHGMAEWRALGTQLVQPYFLAVLAQACMRADRVEEARQALGEALAVARSTGEQWYEAELHRLAGDLTRVSGRAVLPAAPVRRPGPHRSAGDDAEAHLLAALDVAHRQQARLFELRAALSLVRHASSAATARAARRRLVATSQSFTDGLEIPELAQARELLGT